MHLLYAYNPQIWPSVITVLLLIALAVYTWQRRSVPGAFPFTFVLLFGALWVGGSVLEILATDLASKVAWIKFQAAWQLPSAIALTCFLLEYTWPGRWLTRRNLILLSIVPLLIVLLILTNDLHHLMWSGFAFTRTVSPQLGPASWIAIAFGYSLVVVNFIILGWLFLHSPEHRWFVVLIVVTQLVFRSVYLLDQARVLRSDLSLDAIGIAFAYVMYSIALFRFHVLNPIPLARQIVIDQMREGMIVVDHQGRVASLNPAGAAFLGLAEEQACGRLLQEVLPSYPLLPDTNSSEAEISLGTGSGARTYLLSPSSLKDWRGQEAGRLLLLHDVTESRQTQAQILEQQRALSMFREREQLARELHDGLGQVLGYTGLRMEATRKLLADGKLATADDQLVKLENIIADAHADVREYILNLRTTPTGERPFFATLQYYLDGFLKNYGLRGDLSIGPGVEEGVLAPEAQVQLFRIIQEAFSNARKHAQANCVHLSFEREDGLVRIRIQDDGQGFNPDQAANEGHFGLHIMRERAEQLGGHLQVVSTPGSGTSVDVEIPMEGKNINHKVHQEHEER